MKYFWICLFTNLILVVAGRPSSALILLDGILAYIGLCSLLSGVVCPVWACVYLLPVRLSLFGGNRAQLLHQGQAHRPHAPPERLVPAAEARSAQACRVLRPQPAGRPCRRLAAGRCRAAAQFVEYNGGVPPGHQLAVGREASAWSPDAGSYALGRGASCRRPST